jgi:hypothetical protein
MVCPNQKNDARTNHSVFWLFILRGRRLPRVYRFNIPHETEKKRKKEFMRRPCKSLSVCGRQVAAPAVIASAALAGGNPPPVALPDTNSFRKRYISPSDRLS